MEPAALERKRAMYLAMLERKRRERPDDLQVLLQYGDSLLHWAEQAVEATECFLEATRRAPGDAEAWMHLAEALVKRSEPEAALVAMGQVRLPDGDARHGRAAALRGDALAGLRRWPEAREAFQRACSWMPGALLVEAKLAMMERLAGDEAGAKKRFARLKERSGSDAAREGSAALLSRRAELDLWTEEWAGAVLWLERAAVAARREGVRRVEAEIHRLLVRAAVACGKLGAAAEAAGALALLEPSPRASLRHAAILEKAGRSAEAVAVLAGAAALYPEDAALRAGLAEVSAAGRPSAQDGEERDEWNPPGPNPQHASGPVTGRTAFAFELAGARKP